MISPDLVISHLSEQNAGRSGNLLIKRSLVAMLTQRGFDLALLVGLRRGKLTSCDASTLLTESSHILTVPPRQNPSTQPIGVSATQPAPANSRAAEPVK
jgi:hypothetical protein